MHTLGRILDESGKSNF